MPEPIYPEMTVDQWIRHMYYHWLQGEHVVLIGQTGSGKTTIGHRLLSVRDYTVVLAVKRNDDTLDAFTRRTPGMPKYRKFSSWPPPPDADHIIMWFKPSDLGDVGNQSGKVYDTLNAIYKSGGWAILIDDTGYTTGTLKRTQDIVVLLNQARSSFVSVVAAATQPTSVAARIPTETTRQVRHYIIFKYRGEDNIKALASMTGTPRREMEDLLSRLRTYQVKHSVISDFLSISHGEVRIVRNPPVRS